MDARKRQTYSWLKGTFGEGDIFPKLRKLVGSAGLKPGTQAGPGLIAQIKSVIFGRPDAKGSIERRIEQLRAEAANRKGAKAAGGGTRPKAVPVEKAEGPKPPIVVKKKIRPVQVTAGKDSPSALTDEEMDREARLMAAKEGLTYAECLGLIKAKPVGRVTPDVQKDYDIFAFSVRKGCSYAEARERLAAIEKASKR
jgi:hypothetical protein